MIVEPTTRSRHWILAFADRRLKTLEYMGAPDVARALEMGINALNRIADPLHAPNSARYRVD